MEQLLADTFMDAEVELRLTDGSRYEGKITNVQRGVVTLEWEEKTTYIATDKIIAVWGREDKAKETPNIGFIGR